MIDLLRIQDAFASHFLSDARHRRRGLRVVATTARRCRWPAGRRSASDSAPAWTESTLVPVWSTTKGPAAATLLLALDRDRLRLATPVHHVWPELGVDVNFAQLLSHQAGLAGPRC